MKYTVCMEIFETIDVDANSEEEAVEKVKAVLMAQRRMKSTDPVKFSVAQEPVAET